MPFNRTKFIWVLLVLIAAPALCIPLFGPYGPALAVFFSVVPLWFAELLPLPVTAVLVPVFTVAYGVVPPEQAFLAFGSDILFLFIGCFWLTKALQKHGWDRRMAYFVLCSRFVGSSPERLILVVALFAFTMGMWVSNTATTAIMVTIGLGIITSLRDRFSSPLRWQKFSLRLLITIAFAASIAGLSTPVGTPPNLIVLSVLREHGLQVTFLEWMKHGLPIAAVILTCMLWLLRWLIPIGDERLGEVRTYFQGHLAALGPVKSAEIQVAFVFFLMVALWILPDVAGQFFPQHEALLALRNSLSIAVVSLGCSLLLFVLPYRDSSTGALLPNLTWEDARDIDWGTLLLFGGGLTLGKMLESSGLAAFLGQQAFALGSTSFTLIALGVIVISVVMSEFTSSTAAASVVVPILIPTVIGSLGQTPEMALSLSLACAFSVSLGFMLPVSTPPNAIIFSTGLVPLRSLIRAGIVLDLIGIAVIFGWTLLRSSP